ncbi:MAG: serine/threonine-protein phosphatase [Desulfobacteraceae bacterium]|nr:serine/threonine-protein phosphatase [Desulfobacteraceae bacterium]MBC2718821.1 serine/threonine-protein phosphatase [Desulfobacteraceae bacterium]
MKYNIAAFLHAGTQRKINQDRVLIQDSIYDEGIHCVSEAEDCFCFVADGIGGCPSGEFAAQFILEQLREKIKKEDKYVKENLSKILKSINTELITFGRSNPDYHGTGTTLVGIIVQKDKFQVVNAGDSQAFVFRNNTMIKLTEDQVLDSFEDNSPITSYFGGKTDNLCLDFDTVLRNILIGDILLLTSDGLFKSLTIKQVKAILSNSKPLIDKAQFILQKALDTGAEDNLGSVLIEVID